MLVLEIISGVVAYILVAMSLLWVAVHLPAPESQPKWAYPLALAAILAISGLVVWSIYDPIPSPCVEHTPTGSGSC